MTTFVSFAQGTLDFDQESSNDENYIGGAVAIQFYGTVGQSFTPSLSTVGFFRVKLGDITPNNSLGATLVINLRSDTINGPILGTTAPVVLGDGFNSSVNFYLPAVVSIVPNTVYFFQVVVQSGDNTKIAMRSDLLGDINYPGGNFYGGLLSSSGEDLWFREGIIVPEASVLALLLVGSSAAIWRHRRRNSR